MAMIMTVTISITVTLIMTIIMNTTVTMREILRTYLHTSNKKLLVVFPVTTFCSILLLNKSAQK